MNPRPTFGLGHFDKDRSKERQTQTKVGKKDQVAQSTLRAKRKGSATYSGGELHKRRISA